MVGLWFATLIATVMTLLSSPAAAQEPIEGRNLDFYYTQNGVGVKLRKETLPPATVRRIVLIQETLSETVAQNMAFLVTTERHISVEINRDQEVLICTTVAPFIGGCRPQVSEIQMNRPTKVRFVYTIGDEPEEFYQETTLRNYRSYLPLIQMSE